METRPADTPTGFFLIGISTIGSQNGAKFSGSYFFSCSFWFYTLLLMTRRSDGISADTVTFFVSASWKRNYKRFSFTEFDLFVTNSPIVAEFHTLLSLWNKVLTVTLFV